MQFLDTDKAYKAAASALRRSLTALGLKAPSHAQALELVAKSLGHASWPAMLAAHAAHAARGPATAAPQPCAVAAQQTTEVPSKPSWKLSNRDGSLDLCSPDEEEDCVLANGLTMDAVEGRQERVYSVAMVSSCFRNEDGSLSIEWAGENNVFWDTQEPVPNEAGEFEWLIDGDFVPQGRCVIRPEGVDFEYLFCEETAGSLRVRSGLVDAIKSWLVAHNLVATALEELALDEEDLQETVSDIGSRSSSALGRAQEAVGFTAHWGEMRALRIALTQQS